jgi:1-acyl-sn-glycerol-3-phosphate acyltransferase
MGALAGIVGMTVLVWLHWRRSGTKLIEFLGLGANYVFARLWHGCRTNGLTACREQGCAILIVNHTCSADPAFVQAGCPRPLSFLMAREYIEATPMLRWLWDYTGAVPVNRNGCDVAAVRAALRRLSEGRIICIFPEGGLSGAGRKLLRPGKCGAALIALRSRAPVIPAFISGGPQHSNVPRAWLVPSRAQVTFGPPVDLSAYLGRPINRKLIEEVMVYLMSRIADLDSTNRKTKQGR